MVLFSNEIKDYLDKLYFYGMTHSDSINFAKKHNAVLSVLETLDKPRTRLTATIPSWKRDNMYSIKIGNATFGYKWDGYNVVVEEVFENLNCSIDRIKSIIRETINQYLKRSIIR
jgi:hypothetical protein